MKEYTIRVSNDNKTERNYRIRVLNKVTIEMDNIPEIENDPNLCYQTTLVEYEHCIRRSDRLDNKVYILLTVCAFIFVMLTNGIGRIADIRFPHSLCEALIACAYSVLIIIASLCVVSLLKGLIALLASVNIKRFDSSEIMERDMVRADKTRVAKYIISLYEEARAINNKEIEKRYEALNKCIKTLICSVILLVFISILGNFIPTAKNEERKLVEFYIYEETGAEMIEIPPE